MSKPQLKDIHIRTTIEPGDLGYVTYMHGYLYHKEHNFGHVFEAYVAEGLLEFYNQYDPASNRAWVCEHNNKIIGFLVLMNRGEAAQLRYFIIDPEYRGIGLGKKLMGLYMEFMKTCGYKKSYLWTTKGLDPAISLYTRHGFVLNEERDTDIFGKPSIEHRYNLLVN
ncbi:MAG: GNAT family N-acetyltransferase [Cyclobacteriaceae bacterium]|nr:GNAT family N-acetyltransferase [Cyclobacteriaceae bacterium]